jgi:hypothetical protein
MATFTDFILACEKKGGGILLREYLALGADLTESELKEPASVLEKLEKPMAAFFNARGFGLSSEEIKTLCIAKMGAKYLSIDYKYLNGPGMSY